MRCALRGWVRYGDSDFVGNSPQPRCPQQSRLLLCSVVCISADIPRWWWNICTILVWSIVYNLQLRQQRHLMEIFSSSRPIPPSSISLTKLVVSTLSLRFYTAILYFDFFQNHCRIAYLQLQHDGFSYNNYSSVVQCSRYLTVASVLEQLPNKCFSDKSKVWVSVELWLGIQLPTVAIQLAE